MSPEPVVHRIELNEIVHISTDPLYRLNNILLSQIGEIYGQLSRSVK